VTTIGAAALAARRRRVGYAEQPAGQCDVVGPVGVGEETVVSDAVETVGQDVDQEAAEGTTPQPAQRRSIRKASPPRRAEASRPAQIYKKTGAAT